MLHPIQEAYIEHTSFQCSYCTPGFILTTKAYLDEQPNPSREEAKAYLAGNLCRCGSYIKIMDSVMDARERVRTTGYPHNEFLVRLTFTRSSFIVKLTKKKGGPGSCSSSTSRVSQPITL